MCIIRICIRRMCINCVNISYVCNAIMKNMVNYVCQYFLVTSYSWKFVAPLFEVRLLIIEENVQLIQYFSQHLKYKNKTYHINILIFRYSARLNYDVSCNMDFHRYPVDQQVSIQLVIPYFCQGKLLNIKFAIHHVNFCIPHF